MKSNLLGKVLSESALVQDARREAKVLTEVAHGEAKELIQSLNRRIEAGHREPATQVHEVSGKTGN